MKGKSSIKEISELSGVSIATVSRVINQNGRFSKDTEKRVRKVIKEMNYQPNAVARGLRKSKVQAVGIIVPDITNEFFAQVTLNLQNDLSKMNYPAFICNTREDSEIERKNLDMLKALQVSGLIYISGAFSDDKETLSVPTVFIDRKPPFNSSNNHNIVLIESDNEQGGYLAATELLSSGCSNIGMITFNRSRSTHYNRYMGYKKALSESGIVPDENMVIEAENSDPVSGYHSFKSLIEKNPHLDGLFCSSDVLAIGALQAIHEIGMKVPESIKLVGFDDISTTALPGISITTIRQSTASFSSIAVKILVSMMNEVNDEPENKQFVLPVELIRRKSTQMVLTREITDEAPL